MSLLDPSSPTTVGPVYCNTVETQDKDLKTTFMDMIEVFKEEMNTPLKSRKTQTVEGNEYKTGQHLNVEIESTKKAQTEESVEI